MIKSCARGEMCLCHGMLGVLGTVLLTVGLVACGSGGAAKSSGSTVATTTTISTARTTSRPAPLARPPAGAHSSSAHPGHVDDSSGDGAAAFKVSNGDNSIPDFGEEARVSERQRATMALVAFLRARSEHDWSKVCLDLAVPVRKQLEGFAKSPTAKTHGCAPILARLSASGQTTTSTQNLNIGAGIAAFRIKGKMAFALFHGPNGSKYVMPMFSGRGKWKMTQLAPIPYPLTPGATAP